MSAPCCAPTSIASDTSVWQRKLVRVDFEREFQEHGRMHSDYIPFELQTGIESIRAFRRAEAISKQSAA